jgi:hypothetical protein
MNLEMKLTGVFYVLVDLCLSLNFVAFVAVALATNANFTPFISHYKMILPPKITQL